VKSLRNWPSPRGLHGTKACLFLMASLTTSCVRPVRQGALPVPSAVTQSLRADILTAQHDTFRTSWNSAERYLTVANVNQGQFGKLFSRRLDGWVYAQPLYMQGLKVPGHGIVNVVFVCTANNTVYAFDADSASVSDPYWSANLGPPDSTPNTPGSPNSEPRLGIISTPVIVPSTHALYVAAATRENGHRLYRLHALEISTGREKFGGPAVISGQVPGTASDAVNGMVAFNPDFHLIRASLAATNTTVYVATAGSRDKEPFHGWLFGYDLSTLRQTAILNLTPNGQEGGVWQSARAPVVDANGSLYVESGNGDYNGVSNFGESILKLATAQGLSVTDWFTPDGWQALNTFDWDLSSAGPLLVPGTRFLIGSGKTGILYVLDTTSMGRLQRGNGQIVQAFQASPGCPPEKDCYQVHDTVFWNAGNQSTLYVWAWMDMLRAYRWSNGLLVTTPIATGALASNYAGGVFNRFGDFRSLRQATAPSRSRLCYRCRMFASSYRAATARERLLGTSSPQIGYAPEDDPGRIPFGEATFDFVTAVCVFHHVPPAARAALVEEMRRVLKPGGTLAIVEHNPYNPVTRLIVSRTPVDADAVLLRSSETRHLLRQAELTVEEQRYFLYFPEWLYRRLGWLESTLGSIPLGGQYAVFARCAELTFPFSKAIAGDREISR
jgi:SAM-dependent methyltransferase